MNQLTPNFHDFLNLPVKYNPDKYVYPLISSSYANTKIQGNVVKQHNHKDFSATTYKPTVSPTYYTTKQYFNNYKSTKRSDYADVIPITKKPIITTTTKLVNLMNSPMNHPSFDDRNNLVKTKKPVIINNAYDSTTQLNKNIYLTTTTPKTTTKVKSLFEQLFGDYDEPEPTEKTTSTTYYSKPYQETTTNTIITEVPNAHSYLNSEHDVNYEYEDYNNEYPITDNIAVENKPVHFEKVPEKPSTEKMKYSTEKPKPINVENQFNEIKSKEKIKLNQNQDAISKEDDENKIVLKNTIKTKEQSIEESKLKSDVNKEEMKKPLDKKETQLDDSYFTKPNKSLVDVTTKSTTTVKVTSLPLGENHITHNNRQPIIVTTNNLKEQLNNEKVPFTPYVKGSLPPSTSNIHIAPDQDVVSFVVGNQQNVDGGQYVGVSFKESPYDHNPFRPLYSDNEPQIKYNNFAIENRDAPEQSGSAINIQPIRNTEASLTVGKPINNIKAKVPGQVLDESLNNNDKEYTIGSKIVFPDTKSTSTYTPELTFPIQHVNKQQSKPLSLVPNREVLKLNSKPMFHQLPSDLTPPDQKEISIPSRVDRIRPPWDPRPGHFYSGRPEYARPPRPPRPPQPPPPPSSEIYDRLDNLPNILPQFRPNARISNGPYYYENVKKPFVRQPLLERPSNKPLELMENLQPPPLPKNIHAIRPHPDYDTKLRQNVPLVNEAEYKLRSTEKYLNSEMTKKPNDNQFEFYQIPPKVIMSNRRKSDEDVNVETLQMIQSKQSDKKEIKEQTTSVVKANEEINDSSEKPLYVVYPVNTPPLKLDVIDNNKKETVVIGTRAELPLPPSEINQFAYEQQTPILNAKDRHDAPILKPHPKPMGFPIKSDFPYHIERPDPSILNPAVPEIPANNNHIDGADKFLQDTFTSNNQWNSLQDVESRIITGSKINAQQPNQISATLKTYTDKPIAVAYTPTEPHYKEYPDKFSMPNYAGSVIPEIRPGMANDNSEFTVSAVMHTHPHMDMATQNMEFINKHKQTDNHRSDNDLYTTHVPPQEFQAPFQASVNLDHQSMSQGWTVIRDKNKTDSSTIEPEITTIPIATTSEFDIENFTPQLIGGFKPLYNYPEDETKKESELNERQE